MAKNKTVGASSKRRKPDDTAVPKEGVDDDKRARGKPVSLHPLSFKQALGVLVRTPPPKKKPK